MKLKAFIVAVGTLLAVCSQAYAATLVINGTVRAFNPSAVSGFSIGDSVEAILDIDTTIIDSEARNNSGRFLNSIRSLDLNVAGSDMFELTTFTQNFLSTGVQLGSGADTLRLGVGRSGSTNAGLFSIAGNINPGVGFYNGFPLDTDVASVLPAIVNFLNIDTGGDINVLFGEFAPPGTFSRVSFTIDNAIVQNVSAVPIPTALPLLATAVGVLGLIGYRRKRLL